MSEKPTTTECVELHQGTRYDVPEGVLSVRFEGVDYHSQGSGPPIPRARLNVTHHLTDDEIARLEQEQEVASEAITAAIENCTAENCSVGDGISLEEDPAAES